MKSGVPESSRQGDLINHQSSSELIKWKISLVYCICGERISTITAWTSISDHQSHISILLMSCGFSRQPTVGWSRHAPRLYHNYRPSAVWLNWLGRQGLHQRWIFFTEIIIFLQQPNPRDLTFPLCVWTEIENLHIKDKIRPS